MPVILHLKAVNAIAAHSISFMATDFSCTCAAYSKTY